MNFFLLFIKVLPVIIEVFNEYSVQFGLHRIRIEFHFPSSKANNNQRKIKVNNKDIIITNNVLIKRENFSEGNSINLFFNLN